MNKTFSNSPDGDVPIPQGPVGPSRNKDRVSLELNSLHNKIRAVRIVTKNVLASLMLAILIIPSALTSPEYAWAVESNLLFEQGTQKSIQSNVILPDHWNHTLQTIIDNEINRHNIAGADWVEHVDQYVQMISHIESDHKRTAYNPSGAMSYFQFKGESVKTAHNRLVNYMRRYDLGDIPRWSVGLYYDPSSLYRASFDKQAVLAIINIIEQDHEQRTDYFAQFLSGDLDAGIKAYYRYHHTNPDQFTIDRTERLFATYFE